MFLLYGQCIQNFTIEFMTFIQYIPSKFPMYWSYPPSGPIQSNLRTSLYSLILYICTDLHVHKHKLPRFLSRYQGWPCRCTKASEHTPREYRLAADSAFPGSELTEERSFFVCQNKAQGIAIGANNLITGLLLVILIGFLVSIL